jgi:hypothetical protein
MRTYKTLLVIVSSTFAAAVFADARCEGPSHDGNTWNLICSADAGDDEDEFQCDYMISVTDDQGENDVVEATGSVSPGDSGVIIWSAADDAAGGVASASIDSGSCQ